MTKMVYVDDVPLPEGTRKTKAQRTSNLGHLSSGTTGRPVSKARQAAYESHVARVDRLVRERAQVGNPITTEELGRLVGIDKHRTTKICYGLRFTKARATKTWKPTT